LLISLFVANLQLSYNMIMALIYLLNVYLGFAKSPIT
jgi:hypothetical protein